MPEIQKVRQRLIYIGDCKMAALQTRTDIAALDDYYLCPLYAMQMLAAELDKLLEQVFAGRKRPRKVFAQKDDGSDSEWSAK